ncbi:protein SAWADEE HOMEODOMAIN HOMOLOG 2-like isoform X1 [Oryza glaberrima]|uniref:protein SAWADEE HOMEODOMAIN HOMOLOG 2-like isoform X1 n=1 Tax=Oryza glaberrima TaxID=4538 RepID=UPI00224C14F9|nr:protein SAWADEE HOMEODOMAIN HOMOLOG 2-like isoform X1 [Oryza glaberrima]XP_052160145.1 protein SAWADEE HOMEODOMAIN HOMOLOG 2-like isoform X1 [Oryza glaberrima]XP_052160146.1 protein SAWADEE HOMEODOMAIN HOMOLOG 2-like isoform X1 [Oryza glaberrima]XP_052160147.1 protein SAWADEE HOMEODOMAIN HOMOLOG 2-like isoform X1 [Oryza glaberrima]XP_052160148.1 protein SAWADEE HOMEODOMAIN HOMOLOG 2-like isoform X1 [Oryza glaberrima]XP_052160149.1 protein SAWADEE HOMEODOMAIN HOMOLOG 2-like isoform X1 [Oryza
MGRPPTPSTGGPGFRFTQEEVAEMESLLRHLNNGIPDGSLIQSLADRFTASAARAGKVGVRSKQVWYWFQNRKYSQRSRNSTKMLPAASGDHKSAFARSSVQKSVKNSLEGGQLEFEAKSVRDGAWYDVAAFLSHRLSQSGELEVWVRFSGFGARDDEWIDVRTCVRQRSHPCVSTECAAVLPGDQILCFQEGKHQALYFDAHVLDAQKRRHDARGCRCRFLVCYDHDDSEEIVPLRKMCRRPETDYRLEILHAAGAANAAKEAVVDSVIA